MPRDKPIAGSDVALQEFLHLSRRQLQQYLHRVETCLDKLTHEQIWSRVHETENAIGNLVLHLAGNVRQWIVSGVGRARHERDRDAEFARREPLPSDELLRLLRRTLDEADAVLVELSPNDLLRTRKIQVYELTVLHAIYHVLWHFAEHTGQIIWATKRMTGQDLGFYGYLNQGDQRGSAAEREP